MNLVRPAERRMGAARVLGLSTGLLDTLSEGDEDAMHRGEQTRRIDLTYRDSADPGVRRRR